MPEAPPLPHLTARTRTWRSSIKVRVALAGTVLALIIVVALAASFSKSLHASFEATLRAQQQTLATQLAAAIDDKLSDGLRAIEHLATELDAAALAGPEQAQAFLTGRNTIFGVFDDVLIFDAQGTVIADRPVLAGRTGKNFATRPGLRAALGGDSHITPPFAGPILGDPVLAMITPVRVDPGVIGAVAGVLDLLKPNVLGRLTDAHVGNSGRLYVARLDGTLVLHPEKAQLLQPIREANPEVAGAFDRYIADGPAVALPLAEALYTFAPLVRTDWIVIASLPAAEALAPLRDLQQRIIWVAALAALLTPPAVWLVAAYLLRGLSLLHRQVLASHGQGVQYGATQITMRAPDEVGDLAEAIRRALNRALLAKVAQARLVDALDSVADAVALFDVDGRLVAWNRRFADGAAGVGVDVGRGEPRYTDLVRARIAHGVHRSGAVDIEAILAAQLALLGDAHGALEEQLNDGTWLRTTARRTADGGTIFTYSDITAVKQRENELRKLSAAIEQSASMIAIVRHDGTIEYVNQKWSEVTGYGAAEAVGRTPAILGSGTTPRATYTQLWETLAAGKSWIGEILNRRKNGDLYWCREVISPLRDAEGHITHFVAVEEDVTERRRTEEELRRSKSLAETASRSKTQFLANMSHELRTPLNAIIGFAEVIRGGVFGPLEHERYRAYIDDIHGSGRHLLGLVNGILDAARIEVGGITLEETEVDLREVIGAALRMVAERAMADGVDLTTDLPEELPLVRGDPRLLLQTTLNLLSNAIKFTPRGGKVRIEAGQRPTGAVWIACRDTGIGIDPEKLGRVFEPFFQADAGHTRTHQGTGLGLAICKAFVEAHGGRIWIESEPGRGSTVTVELPAERLSSPGRDAAGAA